MLLKHKKCGELMIVNNSIRCFVGMMSFFVAIGMLLMLFISSKIGAIILIALLLVLGYWCLICD